MKNTQYLMKSSIGPLYLVASEKGLQGLYKKKQNAPLLNSETNTKTKQILIQAEKELTEYFAGKRKKFEVSLDLQGTVFQKNVWNALLQIPFGQTNSYSDIARKIKNAKAVRAVGSANGKNPVFIIVPCHRVIAANGSLGGYSGGLDLKRKLLKLENIETKN